jgi:hypothetical protein
MHGVGSPRVESGRPYRSSEGRGRGGTRFRPDGVPAVLQPLSVRLQARNSRRPSPPLRDYPAHGA